MGSVNWIDKGLYHHPQVAGCMALKQYMIVERGKKKCLILRFFNEAPFDVSAMEFKLIQLDSNGDTIKSSHVEVKNMKAASGDTYALEKGVVLSDKCVDFRVFVLWVLSGSYKYAVRHGRVIPWYDVKRDADEEAPRVSPESEVERFCDSGRGLAALLSFGVIILGLLAFIYLSMRGGGLTLSALEGALEHISF